MQLALKFWSRLLIWTGILLVVLMVLSLVMGQGFREVMAHLPTWSGLALALAAFPAGIAVSSDVIPSDRLAFRRLVEWGAAAAALVIVFFVLGNFVAPGIGRALDAAGAAEPVRMSWGELRAEMFEAVEQARSGGESVERWRGANILVWHYIRRTDGSVLPFLFGLIGLLAGFWARPFSEPKLRQTIYWGMGLFLLMSTYLAGENSFEMIVMRSAGQAFFAGDLVLVVPSLLVLGMGWPTFVTIWQQKGNSEEAWVD